MYESGRKPMLVTFGAIVVFHQNNKLEARVVRDSILICPIDGKARGSGKGPGDLLKMMNCGTRYLT